MARLIPKTKLFECMDIIRTAVFTAPIKTHQVLIANLAKTGVDLIACADRDACIGRNTCAGQDACVGRDTVQCGD